MAAVLLAFAVILSPQATPDYLVLYRVKRLQEKIFFRFKFSDKAMVDFYIWQLNERLRELQALAKMKEFDLLYGASLRFQTQAGELVEVLIGNPDSRQLVMTILLFRSYQRVLAAEIEKFPIEDSGNWKYVQDDINYLEIYIEKLNEN